MGDVMQYIDIQKQTINISKSITKAKSHHILYIGTQPIYTD